MPGGEGATFGKYKANISKGESRSLITLRWDRGTTFLRSPARLFLKQGSKVGEEGGP